MFSNADEWDLETVDRWASVGIPHSDKSNNVKTYRDRPGGGHFRNVQYMHVVVHTRSFDLWSHCYIWLCRQSPKMGLKWWPYKQFFCTLKFIETTIQQQNYGWINDGTHSNYPALVHCVIKYKSLKVVTCAVFLFSFAFFGFVGSSRPI